MSAATLPSVPRVEFPALRDPRYPVHKIADALEPYLRAIVERIRPEKIILFGSQAYGEPNEHSDVDLLVIRRELESERQSNIEIRMALFAVEAPNLPFTILSHRPRISQAGGEEGTLCFPEIAARGVELYAA